MCGCLDFNSILFGAAASARSTRVGASQVGSEALNPIACAHPSGPEMNLTATALSATASNKERSAFDFMIWRFSCLVEMSECDVCNERGSRKNLKLPLPPIIYTPTSHTICPTYVVKNIGSGDPGALPPALVAMTPKSQSQSRACAPLNKMCNA
jgi:hypothetical protein